MGACTFKTIAHGKDVRDAFSAARAEAQYEHGHGGYSGTIAEKPSAVLVAPGIFTRERAAKIADQMIGDQDPRVDDKWGPAGAIEVESTDPGKTRAFLFFGWASS